MRHTDLSLSAQTAYAELFAQTQAFELNHALADLAGAFHKRQIKGRDYWYFGYRDIDGGQRMLYVGPDGERIRALVARLAQTKRDRPLAPQARMAIAAGGMAATPKHYRIVRRLAEYGFFRAGGILVGTHAFLALGNLLGVRWRDGATTLDVDLAHAGRNISVALPADVRIDVHRALESLEMGLLPITQLNGRAGAQYRNPGDPALRIDFLTSMTRSGKPVAMPGLNLVLQPLKFMEFSLESSLQACLFSNSGACIVNVPAPERFAVHKLIVRGERPAAERTKALKDVLQAAALIDYFMASGQRDLFAAAWQDALARGKGWRERACQGRAALLAIAPELAAVWS